MNAVISNPLESGRLLLEKNRVRLAVVFLILLTIAAYLPTLSNDFVAYDDPGYITECKMVQKGITAEGVAWSFTTFEMANWHPLSWLSMMLDCQIFGLEPAGHHLTSLLIHLLNVVLLFLLFRRLTAAFWCSFWLAAFFGVHPLGVESVAWAAERKNVLSTLFMILTIWSYARFTENRSPVSFLLTLLLFGLGLMSKPMLVTLPFALLLLDVWPLQRLPPGHVDRSLIFRLIWEKIPLFLLAAGSCWLTYYAQQIGGSVVSLHYAPIGIRVVNAMNAYLGYVWHLFWPVSLCAIYPYPRFMPSWWQTVGVFLVLAALTGLAVRQLRRQPYLAVGWFWYLGTLVPVIGLVQVGAQAMADRYMYVPMLGLLMAGCWGLSAWQQGLPPGRQRQLIPVAATAILLAFAGLTWRQTGYWKNMETVFGHALAVTTDNGMAHHAMGIAMKREKRDKEALYHFEQALKYMPTSDFACLDAGFLYEKKKKYDMAFSLYLRAARLKPGNGPAHFNIGNLYLTLNQVEPAEQHLRLAIQYKPDLAEAWINLGTIQARRGDLAGAEKSFRTALELKPDEATNLQANLQANLGVVLLRQGKLDEAGELLAQAVKNNPESAEAQQNYGIILALTGKLPDAIRCFRQSLLQSADNPEAYYALGSAWEDLGEPAKAVPYFRSAVRLRPDWPQALRALAWTLATHQPAAGMAMNPDEALKLALKAVELTGGKEPQFLDTLAAAYAQAGQFPAAVRTAQTALELMSAPEQAAPAAEVRARLELYRQSQPFTVGTNRR